MIHNCNSAELISVQQSEKATALQKSEHVKSITKFVFKVRPLFYFQRSIQDNILKQLTFSPRFSGPRSCHIFRTRVNHLCTLLCILLLWDLIRSLWRALLSKLLGQWNLRMGWGKDSFLEVAGTLRGTAPSRGLIPTPLGWSWRCCSCQRELPVRPNSSYAEFCAWVVLNHNCFVVLGLNWP